MSAASFEHLALLEMLERVQSLERDMQLLMSLNAKLVRRLEHLEAIARAEQRCGLSKVEQRT